MIGGSCVLKTLCRSPQTLLFELLLTVIENIIGISGPISGLLWLVFVCCQIRPGSPFLERLSRFFES